MINGCIFFVKKSVGCFVCKTIWIPKRSKVSIYLKNVLSEFLFKVPNSWFGGFRKLTCIYIPYLNKDWWWRKVRKGQIVACMHTALFNFLHCKRRMRVTFLSWPRVSSYPSNKAWAKGMDSTLSRMGPMWIEGMGPMWIEGMGPMWIEGMGPMWI